MRCVYLRFLERSGVLHEPWTMLESLWWSHANGRTRKLGSPDHSLKFVAQPWSDRLRPYCFDDTMIFNSKTWCHLWSTWMRLDLEHIGSLLKRLSRSINLTVEWKPDMRCRSILHLYRIVLATQSANSTADTSAIRFLHTIMLYLFRQWLLIT